MHDGEHIHTYTGIEFYIIDPQEEDIDIHDIAHPLSLLCRANGHCRYFYSVAQHTLNCARGGCRKRTLASRTAGMSLA